MKSIIISIICILITLDSNSQFEFKNTLAIGTNPTVSSFVDSTAYLSVLDKVIYVQPLTQTLTGMVQTVDIKINCSNVRILQVKNLTSNEIGLLVKECNPGINAYYIYHKTTNTFNKLLLPNGKNGFLQYLDSRAKVKYIVSETGKTLYMHNEGNGSWDSIGNNNISIAILKMDKSKGIVYEINHITSEITPAYTPDGGKTLSQLRNIDFNKPPFSKANNGTLYELKVITDNYWFARYSYDTADRQISKVYFTTDQGTTWKVAFPFDVTQIVAAGESDAYVYRAQPGLLNGELYKVSEMGSRICKTNFKGTIAMMNFWDSDNGLILALDTPNQKVGVWRLRNSGGTQCTQVMSALAIKNTSEKIVTTFSVNPNPASSSINLSAKRGQHFSVLNMLGQSIMEGRMSQETQSLDISTLPVGVYLMKVGDDVKKWIKE